ncbi:hypothetical protein ACHAXT_001898 [Thalassiosira profunda]
MIDVDEPASGGDDRRFLHKVMSSRGGPQRRDTPEFTDSTLFSVPSSAASPAAGGTTGTTSSGSKRKGKKKSKLASLGAILRRGRKKSLSEAQLRKRLRRAAERGDWDVARKLIAEHEFSAVPEAMPKRGSFNADVIPEEPPPTCATTHRRPSYGSRGGDSVGRRRSFTGKESAAAAAVIKAALFEEGNSHGGSGENDLVEGSAEKQRPDIGENVLHDLCHFRPPLDVLELLLAGLRNRIGSTYGTDDMGRTPLHVAAGSGASPEAIDALVRADPSPASIGDADSRTPLHLAVRCLVHPPLLQGNNAKHLSQETPSPEETIEQTLRIVRTLKEAMLTYPGRIDFKAEDATGYSPLDYALDGSYLKHFTDDNTRHQELLQALIRRKEPRCRRSRPRGITMRSSRSVHSAASSVTEDQDLEILLQLEREEVDARRRRLDKMKAKRKKERMSDALFDVFGIEEQHDGAGVPAHTGGGASAASPPPQDNIGGGAIQSPGILSAPQSPPGTTDEDQYHRHLEAYLDGYFDDDDFGGLDLEEDHGSFDIFEDPSEAKYRDREGVPEPETELDVVQPPVFEIRVDEAEDDQSIVSEVTVPLHA